MTTRAHIARANPARWDDCTLYAEMRADYDEQKKYGRIMAKDMQFYGIHSWDDLLFVADSRERMAKILRIGLERMVPRACRGELGPEDNIIFDGM